MSHAQTIKQSSRMEIVHLTGSTHWVEGVARVHRYSTVRECVAYAWREVYTLYRAVWADMFDDKINNRSEPAGFPIHSWVRDKHCDSWVSFLIWWILQKCSTLLLLVRRSFYRLREVSKRLVRYLLFCECIVFKFYRHNKNKLQTIDQICQQVIYLIHQI